MRELDWWNSITPTERHYWCSVADNPASIIIGKSYRELLQQNQVHPLWHGTLSEMGMVVISSTLTLGPIAQTLHDAAAPIGEAGQSLTKAFTRFADDLKWWTEAAKAQRVRAKPPY